MKRSVVRLAGLALGAAAAASFLFACQLIVGVKDDPGVPQLPERPAPPPSEAGDSAVADLCSHATFPREPPDRSTNGTALPPKWFAFRSMRGISPADGPPIGFDLDGVCTGFTGPTKFDGGSSCRTVVPDDDGGVDNGFSRLAAKLPFDYGNKLFEVVEGKIAAGERTLLLYLKDYNGQPNDSYVQVRLVSSELLHTTECGSDAGPVATGPRWQGCDAWSYGATSLIATADSGPAPSGVQDGFVKDGLLVVGTTSSTELEIGVGGFQLKVTNSFLVAKISQATNEAGAPVFELSGLVAGRVAPGAVFTALSRASTQFCDTTLLNGLAKATVCDSRDIAELPSQDHTDQPCGAISAGLEFRATEAVIGPPVEAGVLPQCDAALPTCDTP